MCVYLFAYLMQCSDACSTSRRLPHFVLLGEDEFWEFIYTLDDAVAFSPVVLCQSHEAMLHQVVHLSVIQGKTMGKCGFYLAIIPSCLNEQVNGL